MPKKSKRLSAKAMHKKYDKPIILAHQPTHFRILTEPKELAEWEVAMARRVGINLQIGALAGISKLATCCGSQCPSIPASGDNIDDDDSDID